MASQEHRTNKLLAWLQGSTQRTRTVGITLGLVAALAIGGVAAFGRLLFAGPQPNGTGITTTGWTVSPAGKQIQLGDRPYGMTLSPDGRTLLVSNDGQSTQSVMMVDTASGEIRQTIPYTSPESLYIGVAFSPDGKRAYASAGGQPKIRVYNVAGQQLTETAPISATNAVGLKAGNPYPAGLAVSPNSATLYATYNLSNTLAIIDTASGTVKATVPVGQNPYTVALSREGSTAYVSNWGEKSVSVVDLVNTTVSRTIRVGTHPSAMALNPRREELYVANSDSDTVSVIDTTIPAVVRTIDLAPYSQAQAGSSPNALAVAGDGNTLYVANAGNNDIAVIALKGGSVTPEQQSSADQANRDAAQSSVTTDAEQSLDGAAGPKQATGPATEQVQRNGNTTVVWAKDYTLGMIPTAWYPTGLAIAANSKQLFVANAKGLGAGPNVNGPNPYRPNTPADQYVGSMIKSSLSIIDVPTSSQLAAYTRQVVKNNGFNEREKVRDATANAARVIPQRPGDPSPIKHIIYIVKENRTYDQVFGSLGRGNGDPSINLFDDDSAPNHRALAKQFVTLDNFYAAAEVSADGWNWSTAAYANTYVQKNWPANYSGRNRPYEFEGGNLATAPNKNPENAYLWDRLDQAEIPYRNYGFFVFGGKVAATEPGLGYSTDLAFPGYNLNIKDQVRADEWLKEFRAYEQSGILPAVELVRLPNDHTSGTRAGAPTPKAMVADNDLALGRVVDAVSHSRFWKDTAIFVVEDDAQNGPDHVDAHRTVALVISPYSQIGKVDSTFYSTVSMLRTIELIAGLRPLTQFDAAATPLLNSFVAQANATPYNLIKPRQSLDELNTASAPLSQESQKMDLSVEDRAPESLLNQAVWQSVKGAGSEMPAPKTAFRSAPDGDDEQAGQTDTTQKPADEDNE